MKEGLVLVTRGDFVECIHRCHIVLVDKDSKIIYKRGDSNFLTCLRSSAKPLQAITALRTGIYEAYNLTQRECAALTGSLNGEMFQIETVKSILSKAGLTEDFLQCGAQYPSHRKTAEALKKEGIKPAPIFHNCSAKHAGMLLASKLKGYPLEDYLNPAHPLQKMIVKTVVEFCNIVKEDIKIVIDGCGAPVFFMPIYNLAVAYKNLAISNDLSVKQLFDAVEKYPEMVAGTGRLCTDIISITKGRIFAKVGADGVYAAYSNHLNQGLAMKVEDGSTKALNFMFVNLLKKLSWITDEEFFALQNYVNIDVKNSRGETVGKYLINLN